MHEEVVGGNDLAAAISEVIGMIRSVRENPPALGPVLLADA